MWHQWRRNGAASAALNGARSMAAWRIISVARQQRHLKAISQQHGSDVTAAVGRRTG